MKCIAKLLFHYSWLKSLKLGWCLSRKTLVNPPFICSHTPVSRCSLMKCIAKLLFHHSWLKGLKPGWCLSRKTLVNPPFICSHTPVRRWTLSWMIVSAVLSELQSVRPEELWVQWCYRLRNCRQYSFKLSLNPSKIGLMSLREKNLPHSLYCWPEEKLCPSSLTRFTSRDSLTRNWILLAFQIFIPVLFCFCLFFIYVNLASFALKLIKLFICLKSSLLSSSNPFGLKELESY